MIDELLKQRILEFRAQMLALDARYEGGVPHEAMEALVRSNADAIAAVRHALFTDTRHEPSPINWPDWLAYYTVPAILFTASGSFGGKLERIRVSLPPAGTCGPLLHLTAGQETAAVSYGDIAKHAGAEDADARREILYASEAIWPEFLASGEELPAALRSLCTLLRDAFPGVEVESNL